MRTMTLLIGVLALGACDKGNKAGPADKAATADKATPEDKAGAEAAMPPSERKAVAAADGAGSAAAAAGAIKDMAEYEARGVAFIERIEKAFTSAGTDCEKATANLNKAIDESQGEIAAVKAYEAANPEAEKTLETKMQPRVTQFEGAIEPTIKACSEHKPLLDALARLDD